MPATMTTVNAILKEVYGPRIEDQLQSEALGPKRIERTSEGVFETAGGKYVDFPIRVGRNQGIGYRNESEALPASGQQKYAEVHVGLKYGYGAVRFTGQVMELAKSNKQAFANAMDRENEGLKDDIVKDSSRIFYGDSTGLMASITSTTASSATQAVDSVQRLEVGQIVDVLVRSSGATVVLNTTINAISGLNVTFGAAFTGAATQGVYRQGSYQREPSGLGNIISTTTVLHGLDPAVEPKWKANVNANGGANRALSESMMIQMVDDIRVAGGGRTSLILTSLGVRRAYFNLLTQQRRYADTKEFAGGFKGLAFNHGDEIPVIADVDSPPSTMNFLDEDKFKIYRNKPWHWADEDGNVLKWVTGFDVWEALLRQYSEFGCGQRNAQGVLEDITEG